MNRRNFLGRVVGFTMGAATLVARRAMGAGPASVPGRSVLTITDRYGLHHLQLIPLPGRTLGQTLYAEYFQDQLYDSLNVPRSYYEGANDYWRPRRPR